MTTQMAIDTKALEAAVLEAAMELVGEATYTRQRLLDILRDAIKPYSQVARTRDKWLAFEAAVTALDYAERPDHYCSECRAQGEVNVTRKCCSGRDCCCNGMGVDDIVECTACGAQPYLGAP